MVESSSTESSPITGHALEKVHMATATVIRLTDEERQMLRSWANSSTTQQRFAFRAKVILMADQGQQTQQIAQELGVYTSTVSKWRTRFATDRIAGLKDAPRSGKPPRYDEDTERRILAVLDEPPPKGFSTWNGGLIAQHLGDVSAHHVWRILRKHGIHLQRQRSWCISTDPQFAQKAADIVGLYLNPPENAVVLSVDEKPHIQALERAQGWLRLPNGRAITGRSHQYKRHGTTTLFAAFDIMTGLVKTSHFNRRRRREFLQFINQIVAQYPDTEIHVVLDNLNTHKPKHDRWLARHKNVHFHYTPTHASWMNQIETWFSILTRSALRGASFTSPQQLRQAIDDFVEAYNQDAAPFEWTKTIVRPKGLKRDYADLCN
jgi:transposase